MVPESFTAQPGRASFHRGRTPASRDRMSWARILAAGSKISIQRLRLHSIRSLRARIAFQSGRSTRYEDLRDWRGGLLLRCPHTLTRADSPASTVMADIKLCAQPIPHAPPPGTKLAVRRTLLRLRRHPPGWEDFARCGGHRGHLHPPQLAKSSQRDVELLIVRSTLRWNPRLGSP